MKAEILYFGCKGQAGHYLWSAPRGMIPRLKEATPWGNYIDGGILKEAKIPDTPDGRVAVSKKDGWTAVSLWDRSVDRRPGSSSTFIVHADMACDDLILLAREQWPQVFSRAGFPNLAIPASQ